MKQAGDPPVHTERLQRQAALTQSRSDLSIHSPKSKALRILETLRSLLLAGIWGSLAPVAYCSATRRSARQDRGPFHGAVCEQVLWHVHSRADKWIPLFTQPRIAFGFDLAEHFVSSASLSRDGLRPAPRVKQVLLLSAELEARGALRAQSSRGHAVSPSPFVSAQSKTSPGLKGEDLVLLLRRAVQELLVTAVVTQSWLVLPGAAPVQREALRPRVPGQKGVCRAYS